MIFHKKVNTITMVQNIAICWVSCPASQQQYWFSQLSEFLVGLSDCLTNGRRADCLGEKNHIFFYFNPMCLRNYTLYL